MNNDTYLYKTIAEDMTQAIQKGVYREGQRLPSLRKICDRYNVSMATAVRAYTMLENSNYIMTHERSGYFVRTRPSKHVSQPTMLQITDQPCDPPVNENSLRLLAALATPNLFHFGSIASPCSELIPVKSLVRHMNKAIKADSDAICKYTRVTGELEMRTLVARKMVDCGCSVSPDDIIMTAGCQGALVLALSALVEKGDIVAVESPIYMGITHLLDLFGLRSIEIPVHPQEGTDLNALEQIIRRERFKAFICIPTCHNPLGGNMSESNKRQLVEMLSKVEIPIIEDDAMGDLVYQRPRPNALKAYDDSGNVLYCSSFSKTLGPGHRMGWLIPGRYLTRAHYIKGVTSFAPPVYAERALVSYLKSDTLSRTIQKATAEYQRRILLLRKWVADYFPDGTNITSPKGGFLLWIEMPKSIDADAMMKRAMEQNIAIGQGTLFSRRRVYTNHIRLSCASADMAKIQNAVKILGRIAHE